MKVLRLEETHELYQKQYGSASELSEYDFKTLEDMGVDTVAYWYSCGSYEGSGELIGRIGDEWFYMNLSHCSCYGPVDSKPSSKEKSLADLEARMTKELCKDVEPLFELLTKEGYE